MSLDRCTLSWQAFTTCASHAMSTEKQEVMGLLLGRWDTEDGQNGPTVTVDHAMILTRTDKREDRVEVGYKQLAEASSIAEKMSEQLGQDTRVVGWYHSHPHITVLPSHVDVRTQGQYQSMDKRFIGLIFSVFSEDKNSKVGTIEVTAFQAMDTSEVVDPSEGGVGRGGASRSGPSDWVRREVALSLHSPGPGSSTTPLADALERVVRLQDTLYGEERAGYLDALRQNDITDVADVTTKDGKERGIDLLSKMFCAAVYSRSLFSLTGDSAAPLAETLRSQLNILKNRVASLEKCGNELRSQLTPAELEEAVSLARARIRKPCSAGIGAFQAHEGEQDIPRADALRFARAGGALRRARILQGTSTMVHFKVFREYSPKPVSANETTPSNETAPHQQQQPQVTAGRDVEASAASIDSVREGGVWVVQVGNSKRLTMVGLRADESTRQGLVFLTEEEPEIEVTCDDQEAYRMWLGVAAAVCPDVGGGARGSGSTIE